MILTEQDIVNGKQYVADFTGGWIPVNADFTEMAKEAALMLKTELGDDWFLSESVQRKLICSDYFELVKDLIYFNYKHREFHEELRKNLSPRAWLYEFCTIRLNVGRRVGKTEFIKSNARPGDIVIVPFIISKIPYGSAHCFALPELERYNHFYPTDLQNFNPSYIWCDEANLSNDGIELIFNHFCRPELDQTLIILGA